MTKLHGVHVQLRPPPDANVAQLGAELDGGHAAARHAAPEPVYGDAGSHAYPNLTLVPTLNITLTLPQDEIDEIRAAAGSVSVASLTALGGLSS